MQVVGRWAGFDVGPDVASGFFGRQPRPVAFAFRSLSSLVMYF